MDPKGSNYWYFKYVWDILVRADFGDVAKPDKSVRNEDVKIEDILKHSAIYGSKATVIDKIAALRERTGPFGTLLLTGIDGAGVNGERERHTMRLLAEEVMPKFR